MKNIYTYLMMAVMAVALVSCESEDEQVARTLEGDWQGTMSEFFYSRWGPYLSGNHCYTYFTFVRTSPAAGYGTEVDEDEFGNWIERDFTWNVNYEYGYDYGSDYFDIYLRYDSRYYVYDYRSGQEFEYRAGVYDAVIYDAYLSGNYFSGKIEGSDGSLRQFRMTYVGRTRSNITRASSAGKKPVIVIDKLSEHNDSIK